MSRCLTHVGKGNTMSLHVVADHCPLSFKQGNGMADLCVSKIALTASRRGQGVERQEVPNRELEQ